MVKLHFVIWAVLFDTSGAQDINTRCVNISLSVKKQNLAEKKHFRSANSSFESRVVVSRDASLAHKVVKEIQIQEFVNKSILVVNKREHM